MLFSLAIIILAGLLLNYLFERMGIPGLVGMLLAGIALGPEGLGIIHPLLVEVSTDFRTMALVIILLRAGLRISRSAFNRVGTNALMLSFLPSALEGLAIMWAATVLLDMTLVQGAMLGFIVAAVSPAVIVPSMISLMDERMGQRRSVPTMLLAGSLLDNAFTIVVFYTMLEIYGGAHSGIGTMLMRIPISMATGAALGVLVGLGLSWFYKHTTIRHTKKTLVLLGVAVLMIWAEKALKGTIPLSALVGVMALGLVLLEKAEPVAHALSSKLAKLWLFAEILLFVLVGSQVQLSALNASGLAGLFIIAIGLLARAAGTFISTMGGGFTLKERLFSIIAFIPKATVQAAIGSIPLAMGIPGGSTILCIAVLSIITTAPLGAIGIKYSYKHLLEKG